MSTTFGTFSACCDTPSREPTEQCRFVPSWRPVVPKWFRFRRALHLVKKCKKSIVWYGSTVPKNHQDKHTNHHESNWLARYLPEQLQILADGFDGRPRLGHSSILEYGSNWLHVPGIIWYPWPIMLLVSQMLPLCSIRPDRMPTKVQSLDH